MDFINAIAATIVVEVTLSIAIGSCFLFRQQTHLCNGYADRQQF